MIKKIISPLPLLIASSLLISVNTYATDRMFPIWGNEAKAQGYDIPEPFGISISHMNIRQPITVQQINFQNLAMGSIAIPQSLFEIDVAKTWQKSTTNTLRIDTWLFPFMNVYGIFAKTKGHSISQISVTADPSKHPGMQNAVLRLIARGVLNAYNRGDLKDFDFRLDFEGKTYGVGTTFASGYNNFFATLDINYTQTHFDILDGQIKALTLSPRVGYRFTTPSIDMVNIGPGKLNVWMGSMYQNVDQIFKGNLTDLNMPPALQTQMQLVNQEGLGRFRVKQRLTSPWNVLVGTRYEITKNFALISEIGFEKRNSFFISGEFRF